MALSKGVQVLIAIIDLGCCDYLTTLARYVQYCSLPCISSRSTWTHPTMAGLRADDRRLRTRTRAVARMQAPTPRGAVDCSSLETWKAENWARRVNSGSSRGPSAAPVEAVPLGTSAVTCTVVGHALLCRSTAAVAFFALCTVAGVDKVAHASPVAAAAGHRSN